MTAATSRISVLVSAAGQFAATLFFGAVALRQKPAPPLEAAPVEP